MGLERAPASGLYVCQHGFRDIHGSATFFPHHSLFSNHFLMEFGEISPEESFRQRKFASKAF